jgi:hypothetical protein
MRPSLGTLTAAVLTGMALAVTAACGSTSSTVGSRPDSPSAGPVQGAHVTLFSLTGGGGRVSTRATLIDTPAQLRRFTTQFGQTPMRNLVQKHVMQARNAGLVVYGAVVEIGCDRPPGADVSLDGSGNVVITPREVASPLPECLAAVTTVAIASVPGAQ